MKYLNYNKLTLKTIQYLFLVLFLVLNITLPNYSADLNDTKDLKENNINDIKPVKEANPISEDLPIFNHPVTLLVGLNNSELSYHEISNLAGFELFSVPYRSDIKAVVEQIKPSQIIIKHPSGFVGLYSIDGQLIRGVRTAYTENNNQIAGFPEAVPPSIIQPIDQGSGNFQTVWYPGAVTGTVPHGGLGYTPPPRGRNFKRHLLKIAAFGGLVPFQYPGYWRAGNDGDRAKLLPNFLFPAIPSAISAASAYSDARLESGDYEAAKTQPRDYMFQPIIEGY